jgi:hypothetical protein
MDINEIIGQINHSLALNWNDKVAQARDLLLEAKEATK